MTSPRKLRDKTARLTALHALLLEIFPRDRDSLQVPHRHLRRTGDSAVLPARPGDVHVFVDLSNIYIRFNTLTHEQLAREPSVASSTTASAKMDMELLDLILGRGRRVRHKVLCGSAPKQRQQHRGGPGSFAGGSASRSATVSAGDVYQAMFAEARALGYEVTIMERRAGSGNGGGGDTPDDGAVKEHGVDEMLAFKILELVLSTSPPSTIVLATGDGQPGAITGSIGFFRAISKALAAGWTVELYSFGNSLSQNWVRLKETVAHEQRAKTEETARETKSTRSRFKIIYLDEFAPSLHDETYF